MDRKSGSSQRLKEISPALHMPGGLSAFYTRAEISQNARHPRSSHRAGAVLDVELVVNVVKVPLQRAFGDEYRFGDLLVAQARLQALQDRQLSLRQIFDYADQCAAVDVRRAQRAMQAARQGCSLGAAELLHVESVDQ